MSITDFQAYHINATPLDLEGNNGIGRYVFLPGSDGRAKEIAEHFTKKSVKQHSRGHNLYLGTLTFEKQKIDVAAVSTGMGCASTEIIVHELFKLGARRFLRIGTAGSLQPQWISAGHIINVQGSVRDEDTTRHYVPTEFPALASLEMVSAILLATKKLNLAEQLHTGIVHCKSSLYAREAAIGPYGKENQNYIDLLVRAGVLATEMETAALFIQSQLYNHQLLQQGHGPEHQVLAGAILAIIGQTAELVESTDGQSAIKNAIELGLETIKILASQEH